MYALIQALCGIGVDMCESNNSEVPDLDTLRQQIDECDRAIVDWLNRRAEVVVNVGKRKRCDNVPVYSPDREQAVLQKLRELNKGPLPQKTLDAIYRELMSGSFALEKPLRIGYLGPEGSFSHMAAMRKFGASVEYLPLPDLRAIFDEVIKSHCDMGMVPIENSLGGGVIDTMDCFVGGGVQIRGEVFLEVNHNLLANCSHEEIEVVASRPEVFAQCRKWLSTTMEGVELLPVASSAKAAQMAVSEPRMAAIGSVLSAELYGLKIVFANIEDNTSNQTRFYIIGTEPALPTGNDKTSIMFSTPHKAGALTEVLNVLSYHGVNLTNIDNRPSRRKNWEYYFFVDLEGHVEDQRIRSTLEEVADHCSELTLLGSYPRAENI